MEKRDGKTEKQKMLNEELYYAGVEELHNELVHSKEMCYDYNQLRPSEVEKKKSNN